MNHQFDFEQMHWMRKPEYYLLQNGKLIIETDPFTSFHALSFDSTRTCGLMSDLMDSFCFTVRVDYKMLKDADECGIVIRKPKGKWAKAGLENRMDHFDLACTVYGDGFGDRSCRQVGSGIQWLYFRVLYWNGNARFQYSFNGEKYSDMRWLHLASSKELVEVGIYACSPGDTGFDCTFSNMQLHKI